ncbi:hypothetical protein HDR61_00070 [bacterium]|nr:hypothetical protein [bacterium]
MLNVKASVIAQKLLNLYRQEHVIIGGWTVVNQVFVDEATPDVLTALGELPTGSSLVRHIENLRSGKTPMDSIERDLMPYGGAMGTAATAAPVAPEQWNDLARVIAEFTPDDSGLARLESDPVIKQFGAEWLVAIRNALNGNAELQQKWDIVTQTYRAYRMWNNASQIINTPISDRVRAQLQVDMPEYETYLPMFGDAGMALLGKLRTFLSGAKSDPNQTSDDNSVEPVDAPESDVSSEPVR